MNKVGRVIYLKPREYKWVKNILTAAKYDFYLRRNIIAGTEMNDRSERILMANKQIQEDGHGGYTIVWSVEVARDVIKNKLKLKSHPLGVSCE